MPAYVTSYTTCNTYVLRRELQNHSFHNFVRIKFSFVDFVKCTNIKNIFTSSFSRGRCGQKVFEFQEDRNIEKIIQIQIFLFILFVYKISQSLKILIYKNL